MNRPIVIRTAAAATCLLLAVFAYTQTQAPKIVVNKIKEDLYEIDNNASCNVGVLVTNEGVILVDDKYEQDHDAIVAQVKSVTSQPIKPYLGVFDKDGAKVTVTPDDLVKLEKARKDKKADLEYLNTIFIRREGEAVLPVDVRIKFKNGEVVNEKWDGAYRWIKYEYVRKSEVQQVEVDPGHKLALDVNFTNNSWTSEPAGSVVVKWASTMLFWIQNVLHLASVVA